MPEIAVERQAGRSKQRARLVLGLAVVATGLSWTVWKWREVRVYRKAIAQIEEDLDNGRNWIAARNLATLLAWRPDSDEATYLLGVCEKARGRIQAASKAWARVPPGSPFAPRTIQGLVELEIERGRFADAEQLIERARRDPRIEGSGLGLFLGPAYCLQGRVEEARRFVATRWDYLDKTGEGASEQAIGLVRLHIELQARAMPVETVRAALDQAARSAPEDDRIWLGKANLALRVGSYDEAARWLDACLRRRPEDLPVWRARLDWALATHRVEAAQVALEHLPAGESSPTQVHRLAAWFAARRGDVPAERRALECLLAADPTDASASQRLVELAVQEGQPARAAELRRQRAEIDRLEAQFHELHQRNQPLRDAAEMARLAAQLGHGFEAKGFLTVATALDPDRDDLRRELARIGQSAATIMGTEQTLAEVLATELAVEVDSSSRARRSVP